MDAKSLSFLIILIFFSNVNSNLSNKLKHSFSKFIPTYFAQLESQVQNTPPIMPSITAKCFINNNGLLYDLTSAYSNQDYQLNAPDGNQIIMNFCKKPKNSCRNSTSLLNYKSNSTCVSLSGPNLFNNYFVQYNPLYNATILTGVYPQGDKCLSDQTQNYQTYVNFLCTSNPQIIVINTTSVNINSCVNSIDVIGNFACPNLNTYGLFVSITDNAAMLGFIFFLVGMYLVILGKKFFRITQVLGGVLVVTFLCLYLVLNNLQVEILSWQLWFAMALSVVTGILLGLLIYKLPRGAPIAFSGLSGFCVANILYALFLKNLSSSPTFVYYFSVAVLIGTGIGIGFKYNLYVVLVSINIVGAYLIIRGASYFIGGYPDERQLYELIRRGEIHQVKNFIAWPFFVYLLVFLIFGAGGFYLQYRYFCTPEEKSSKKLANDHSSDHFDSI